MPGKELVTEDCVRRMAPGSELRLGSARIATPAALDLAFERGIHVSYDQVSGGCAPQLPSSLWERIKAGAGTYIVQVEGGRAVVTRLTDQGPQPFGVE